MTTYTHEEALAAARDYFNGDEFAASAFISKYALRDANNELLEKTPAQMHKRVAKEFARIEAKKFKKPLSYEEIYGYLEHYGKIIPQGSPLYGIGNKHKVVSLSNCFVVEPPYDSYGGICKTDEEIAHISKRRGGIGYDISNLRPSGLSVNNAAQTTTGAISFMHRFSHTGREVGQNGRRGAQMISISVHHPDILEFAKIKNDETSVTGANISIRLSDEFLQAVEMDAEYEQRWPIDAETPEVSKSVHARDVWKEIIHSAWYRAEPGLLFWDNIQKWNPAECYPDFRSVGVNPCAELLLSAYDSCRLLAINLFHAVKEAYTKKAYVDYDELYETAKIAQRLMDDLVDLEIEAVKRIIKKIEADPEPEEIKSTELNLWRKILDRCQRGRRTGTGITAIGDVIASLGLKYGSNASIQVVEDIYRTIKLASYEASVDMAEELGAFPDWNWSAEKDHPFLLQIKEEKPELYERMSVYGRRNIANLTTAPTGTISTQASLPTAKTLRFGTTSGIEPCFLPGYTRRKKINPDDEGVTVDFVDKTGDSWQEYTVYHNGVEAWRDAHPNANIENSPYHGACANDINWVQRVKLQAAAQKHVDHSISSTVNLPEDVTEEEVAKIYEAAWHAGCKGITVYRDNCRSGVLISESEKPVEPKERPKELECDVHHTSVRGQEYFVLIGMLDGKPYEIFAGKNGVLDKKAKTGIIIRKKKNFYKAVFPDTDEELSPITATIGEMEECVSRLCSSLLRTGVDMHFIVDQLEKVGERQTELHSFAKAMARILKKYIVDGTEASGECPTCGADSLVRLEGCKSCSACGWTACM